MKAQSIVPKFVEFVPDTVESGVLYVSEKYGTAIHKCCCGCGEEVVTPLNPVDWQLTRVGDAVSLNPSIGNWNYPCKSHYWIVRNRVEWSGQMSKKQIQLVQQRDKQDKLAYVAEINIQRERLIPWWKKMWNAVRPFFLKR